MLADTYNSLGLLSLMKPRVAFQKARLAGERALAIDRTWPRPMPRSASSGSATTGTGTPPKTHFRRALDIDPDLASVRVHYSWLLMLLGREAAALDGGQPRRVDVARRFVIAGAALTYFLAGQYDEAIALCSECLEANPDYLFAIYQLGQVYHMKGMYPAAHAELETGGAASAGARRSTRACSARATARPANATRRWTSCGSSMRCRAGVTWLRTATCMCTTALGNGTAPSCTRRTRIATEVSR